MMPEYSGSEPQGLPVRTGNVLSYRGAMISDRGETLSLTDMWKAAGAPANQDPAQWSRSAAAEAFIEAVSVNMGISHNKLVETKAGRSGGTWAHWQVAFAYAKYLSPDFHMWCNEVVRAHMVGKHAAFQIPQSLSQALRLAADQADTIERQTAVIANLEPKAEFHDGVASAVNAQPFMDVAKVFKTGRTRFTRWLRDRKILQHHNRPYQQYEDAGYFRVVEKKRRDPDTGEVFTYPQTLITGKGIIYLQRKWVEDHPDAQATLQLEGE